MSEAPNAEAEQSETDARTLRAQNEKFLYTVLPNGYVNVQNVTKAENDDEDAHIYTVRVEDSEASGCSCPDHKYRDVECKHMKAVQNGHLDEVA